MTRNFTLLVASSFLALSACQTTEMAETSKAATPSAYDQLIGKRLSTASGVTFIMQPNGKMGGTWSDGTPIIGDYKIMDGVSCSTYTAPERLVGSEFCSRPVISGDTVVFHRTDGSKSPVYQISG